MSAHSARSESFRRARARVLATAQTCAICHGLLDFDAPPKSRWAPSVDHVVPMSRLQGLDGRDRERIASSTANLRAVHYGCNSSRGDRMSRPVAGPPKSRVW